MGIPEYSPEELIETVEIAIDYVIKGCDISVSRQLLALPGAPMYNGSNYKLSTVSWVHPITGEEIKIPDYFIPLDSKVAFALKNFDKAAQQELDRATTHLRVGVKGGGCSGFSYILDLTEAKKEGDEQWNFDFTVDDSTFKISVICDPKSYLYLNGTTVDFKDEVMGRGFVFENPNATTTCGCGSSFNA